MMYGQMTAGSWITLSQGLCKALYETFNAAGDKHFGGDLSGKLIVLRRNGRNGGAQPLAATMTGAAFLGIDVDPERIKKRLKMAIATSCHTLDEALRILKNAVRKKENVSVTRRQLRRLIPNSPNAESSRTSSPTRLRRMIR